eukprot:Colp12_sorted_trinity150504_noHs@17210
MRLTPLVQQLTATVRAVAPSSRPLRPRKAALAISEAAATKIKDLLHDKPDAYGLRIGVKKRGCNGMSYTLDFADKKEKMDEEVKENGVTVLIDSKALMYVLGSEMDFVTNRISSEFVFNNPNAKGTCGCGESFNV